MEKCKECRTRSGSHDWKCTIFAAQCEAEQKRRDNIRGKAKHLSDIEFVNQHAPKGRKQAR
jgi:hypothetical protein